MSHWTPEQLELVGTSVELEVATERRDGSRRRWTPIWVVRVGEEVFVRTWHRRTTGWYGDALRTGRAGARVPGLEVDVRIEDVGEEQRAEVDAAYTRKYGGGGSGRMVGDEAAGTTLRLTPA